MNECPHKGGPEPCTGCFKDAGLPFEWFLAYSQLSTMTVLDGDDTRSAHERACEVFWRDYGERIGGEA